MIRRAMTFALVLGLCVIGGCECLPGTCDTCVPPGCDPCDHECPRPCGPCGPPTACDPHPGVAETRATETRASEDIVAALRSGDRATRERAIESLAGRETSILPQIETLLADPDPNVRYAALQVLVRLRRDAWPSVYHVKWRLQDSDPAVRAEAASVL